RLELTSINVCAEAFNARGVVLEHRPHELRGAREIDAGDGGRACGQLAENLRLRLSAALRFGIRNLRVEHYHRVTGDPAAGETPFELERQRRAQLELGVAHPVAHLEVVLE